MDLLVKDIKAGIQQFQVNKYIEHGFFKAESGTRPVHYQGTPFITVERDPISEHVRVLSDEHTNESLVYEVIRRSGVTVPLRHIWHRADGGHQAVKIYDRPEMATLVDWLETQTITVDLIGKVIRQVLRIYDILATEYEFHHGVADIGSFYVNDKPLKVNYRGIEIMDDFTILIDNFSNARISIKDDARVTCSPYNDQASKLLSLFPVHHSVVEGTKETAYYTVSDSVAFRYFVLGYDIQAIHASYDMYAFLVSFMKMPGVTRIILDNATTQVQIWDVMWYNESTNEMIRWFADDKKATVSEILSNARLKTNIRNMMLSRMSIPLITKHLK